MEKINLGRFILEKFSTSEEMSQLSMAERVRMSFEQLGPTFIKLGQVLSSRPDLIPKDFCEEFKRLHSQVTEKNFEEMEPILQVHFQRPLEEVFASVDKKAIGTASIAQVYRATLKTGERVVIKVQRPGISAIIEEDVGVLFTLADLLETYVPETRHYNIWGIVNEFAKTLSLETNFMVEANNIRRFAENFLGEEDIIIPKVYEELSGVKVLVMEELLGTPLSESKALSYEGFDAEKILKLGLSSFLKMVFKDGLFHGDLHAGNFFIFPGNKIGFIDFGVVGRLNQKVREAVANMLIAISTEDYPRLAYEYVDLAPYSEDIDVDQLASDLRDLIAPFYGLNLEHMNIGKMLMESASIVAEYRLILPAELILYFKAMISIEGMGKEISSQFDFMKYANEFASQLMEARYEPKRLIQNLSFIARDANSLLFNLPRQLRQLLRKWNSPNFSIHLSFKETFVIKRALEKASNLLFLGMIIGSLLVSASLMVSAPSPSYILGIPTLSFIGFIIALSLSFVAFINYIKK